MSDLPDNENKKDLIDLVREGHKIEIYEANQVLSQGDVVRDWKPYRQEAAWDDRRVVGKPIFLFGNSFIPIGPELCEYCNTQMHELIDENRIKRVGRDGKDYYKFWDKRLGKICPLCLWDGS